MFEIEHASTASPPTMGVSWLACTCNPTPGLLASLPSSHPGAGTSHGYIGLGEIWTQILPGQLYAIFGLPVNDRQHHQLDFIVLEPMNALFSSVGQRG